MRMFFLLTSILITCNVLSQEKCTFYQDKVYGDVYLRNSDRGKGGRAMTPSEDNSMTINFGNDFSGGVRIGGWGNKLGALASFNITDTIPIAFTQKIKLTSVYSIGKIGIGVENPKERLEVNGTIRAKEVKIEAIGWADFVFKPEYTLPTLSDLELHIKEKGHLPSIPTESEVKKEGIDVGEMQIKLLQKIEELTLYVINQQKEIDSLKKEMRDIKKE